jgi:hypothetical protein
MVKYFIRLNKQLLSPQIEGWWQYAGSCILQTVYTQKGTNLFTTNSAASFTR